MGSFTLSGQAAVSNVRVNQAGAGEDTRVTVTFDLADSVALNQSIWLDAQRDGGPWSRLTQVSGAVGSGVAPGSDRRILWEAGKEWPGDLYPAVKVRVVIEESAQPAAQNGADLLIADRDHDGVEAVVLIGDTTDDAEEPLTAWLWQWNGGSTSGRLAQGSFPVGDTRVTLSQTTAGGVTTERQFTISVTRGDAPFWRVMAVESTVTGVPVTFTIEGENQDRFDFAWTFDDETSPGLVQTTPTAMHAFQLPGRYRIELEARLKSDPNQVFYHLHYVDVARPFAETAYAVRNAAFGPQAVLDETDWFACTGTYDVYYGKYASLWLQRSPQRPPVESGKIIEFLTLADFSFEAFGELFRWDCPLEHQGLRIVFCESLSGAGIGGEGMGLGFNDLSETEADGRIASVVWESLLHEFIHLWDFRSHLWMQGPDAAHSFTGGMEPIVNADLRVGKITWMQNRSRDNVVSPLFSLHFNYRVIMERYLSNPTLNWQSYFSDEQINAPYGTRPIPENKERMNVQGGLLIAIYQMHGREGLQALFRQLDRVLTERKLWDDDFFDPSPAERNDLFVRALGDALRLNVAPYIDYWKYPLLQETRQYLTRYPSSPMLIDGDGDGIAPLQGDFFDADASVYPNAPELANDGKDNNLDGLIDEQVYTDTAQNDLDATEIQLPAWVRGEIHDLNDRDLFNFNAPSGTRLMATVYPKEAPQSVRLSPDDEFNRLTSLFSGIVSIDGSDIEVLSDFQIISAYAYLLTGTGENQTIEVSAENNPFSLNLTPNPGPYELQLFFDDYIGVDLDPETLIQRLFP